VRDGHLLQTVQGVGAAAWFLHMGSRAGGDTAPLRAAVGASPSPPGTPASWGSDPEPTLSPPSPWAVLLHPSPSLSTGKAPVNGAAAPPSPSNPRQRPPSEPRVGIIPVASVPPAPGTKAGGKRECGEGAGLGAGCWDVRGPGSFGFFFRSPLAACFSSPVVPFSARSSQLTHRAAVLWERDRRAVFISACFPLHDEFCPCWAPRTPAPARCPQQGAGTATEVTERCRTQAGRQPRGFCPPRHTNPPCLQRENIASLITQTGPLCSVRTRRQPATLRPRAARDNPFPVGSIFLFIDVNVPLSRCAKRRNTFLRLKIPDGNGARCSLPHCGVDTTRANTGGRCPSPVHLPPPSSKKSSQRFSSQLFIRAVSFRSQKEHPSPPAA